MFISQLKGRGALVAMAACLWGCGDGARSRGTRPCDPLQATARPVSLGEVIGIGSDTQGAIYVVDRDAAVGERLFISQDRVLARWVAAGAGSVSNTNGTLIVVTGHDAAGANPTTVEVQ